MKKIKRSDGRELQKTTVYLPIWLYKAVKVHCALAGVDMSSIVSKVIAEYMEKTDNG